MALGERLDFPDDAFGATLSSGVFTTGHAPPESLREVVRVTRSGGHVIFSVRETVYLEGGFREQQKSLEQAGKWRMVEQTGAFQSLPLGEPEVDGRVFVYEVHRLSQNLTVSRQRLTAAPRAANERRSR